MTLKVMPESQPAAVTTSEIAVEATSAVLRIRQGRLLAAFAGFLLGDAVELVLPPCPHVYFTCGTTPMGWRKFHYSITCLACGEIVEHDG